MPNKKKTEEVQEATSSNKKTNSEKQAENAANARAGGNSKDAAKKNK